MNQTEKTYLGIELGSTRIKAVLINDAGEGGAWGMAVLASFLDSALSLDDYLDAIFKDQKKHRLSASPEEHEAFLAYLSEYKKRLPAAMAAASTL